MWMWDGGAMSPWNLQRSQGTSVSSAPDEVAALPSSETQQKRNSQGPSPPVMITDEI